MQDRKYRDNCQVWKSVIESNKKDGRKFLSLFSYISCPTFQLTKCSLLWNDVCLLTLQDSCTYVHIKCAIKILQVYTLMFYVYGRVALLTACEHYTLHATSSSLHRVTNRTLLLVYTAIHPSIHQVYFKIHGHATRYSFIKTFWQNAIKLSTECKNMSWSTGQLQRCWSG